MLYEVITELIVSVTVRSVPLFLKAESLIAVAETPTSESQFPFDKLYVQSTFALTFISKSPRNNFV